MIMRWAVWIVIALAAIAGMVALIGSRLPKAHTATRTTKGKMPPDALFTLLSDVDNYKTWRRDGKHVGRLPDRDGRPGWGEGTSPGQIPLFFARMGRPSLRVGR